MLQPELVNQYLSFFSSHLHFAEKILRQAVGNLQKNLSKGGHATSLNSAEHTNQVMNVHERQILTFVTRHPLFFQRLQILGADLLIHSPIAKQLWAHIEEFGENFLDSLDENERVNNVSEKNKDKNN